MEFRRRLRVGRIILLIAAVQVITAAFGVSVLISSNPANAAQTVPYKVNFQGRLTDNSGNILTDGLYNVKFRLWTLSAGGTNQWQEDRVITGVDNRIQITNGLFNIQFGDLTAIAPSLFNTGTGSLFLEVELPTPATAACATNGCAVFTEGAMTPRQPLASSPYAINSDTLDGLDASALVQLSPAGAQTGNINLTGTIAASGTISGTFAGSGASLTNLNPTNLVQGSGAVTLQSANTASVTVNPGTSGSLNLATQGTGKTIQIGQITAAVTDIINVGNSVFAGSIDTITIGSTNTTSTTSILGGTTGSTNIGSVGASTFASTTNIANTANATGIQFVAIGGNANAGSSVDIDGGTAAAGIQIGDTATAHGIRIGSGASAAGAAQTIAIGSGTTTTSSIVTLQGGNITTTNGNSGIVIGGGFSTSDPNLVGLTLDSSNTYTELASSCSNTANGGTIYYNSSANTIRACVIDGINAGGGWEDLPSTNGLGAILFGVVPDSGLAANQGDWAAIGGSTKGPCKVSWATATTLSVAPCVAYSGGRKVVVASATTVTVGTGTSNGWNHVCLNTSGALITPTVIQATEITGLPAFSANNPILCLADVQMINGSGSSIAKIYDVRTFTTSTKAYVTNQTTVAGLGQTVSVMAATNSVTQVPTTTNTSILRGVVVASSGATSATAVNAIITTRGPQWVKFAAAAGTLNAFLQPITGGAAGYLNSSATIGTIGYGNLGLQLRLSDSATCTTTANCQMSVPTDINLR